jgi:hypothetical protein
MHAFLVNVHNDRAQAERLVAILRQFSPFSRVLASVDGTNQADLPGAHETVIQKFQEDKCLGILDSLNALVRAARRADCDVVTLLHPDSVPLSWPTFSSFLKRFYLSGKAIATAPIGGPISWGPHNWAPAFQGITFNLNFLLDTKLLPIAADRKVDWCPEAQAGAHWSKIWPAWREEGVYHLLQFTMPTTDPGRWPKKLGHRCDLVFGYHDYVPETSVIHTNDKVFWNDYEKLVIKE